MKLTTRSRLKLRLVKCLYDLSKQQVDELIQQDLFDGLTLIARSSGLLSSVVNSYKQSTRLANPVNTINAIEQLVNKVIGLFEGVNIIICAQSPAVLLCNRLQSEQVLVNLINIANEAMQGQSAAKEVEVSWQAKSGFIELVIKEQGCGIQNAENLLVPFCTIKKAGTGIGLVLYR